MTTYFKVTLVALFFGILGGIVGQILADAYISPLIESFPAAEINVGINNIPELKKSSEFTGTENDVLVNQVATEAFTTLIGIYSAAENLDQTDFLGNGAILTSDGWILSHSSVTGNLGAGQLAVEYDRRIFGVEQKITDAVTGAVFLKINNQNMPVITFNDWHVLTNGQAVVIVNRRGDTQVTRIENKMWDSNPTQLRSSEDFNVYITLRDDFDKNFNGSAVYNLGGSVIGIAAQFGNLSLVIPPNYFISKIPAVLRDSTVARPELAVEYYNLATTVGLSDLGDQGAVVADAPPAESPAAQAGIEEGDIINQVNGVAIDALNDLALLIQDHRIGDRVNLTVIRDGEEINVEVFLGEL